MSVLQFPNNINEQPAFSETTGEASEHEYDEWVKEMEGLTDMEISEKIKEKILSSPDMDYGSRQLFNDVYNYIQKCYVQQKPVDVPVMKIYLEELHGHNLEECSIMGALTLVTMCGLSIS